MTRRPTILCILDGWGDRDTETDNAIRLASTPTFDRLRSTCPGAQLDASEGFVGLPSGQMGNSEVGHMNIGAGRIVMQDLPRIDAAIDDGGFEALSPFTGFADAVASAGGSVHLLGLMSPGGVHAHQDHIAALANALIARDLTVYVHAILDGRDTPPRSALDYVAAFQEKAPGAVIATVTGRYFAMDRDKRWDRVEQAVNAIVDATGETAPTAAAAIEAAYAAEKSDEFVPATIIGDYAGAQDGDGLLMANFRADRAREILHALIDPGFDGYAVRRQVAFSATLGMVSYSSALDPMIPAIFPPESLADTMGEVVAANGLRQLRIAETEKYAHVTFFFNGGREDVFDGEDRVLIPSPKVATYDLQPEMAAPEVTDKLVEAIDSDAYDFIVVNFANTDMVGHTGNLEAAIKAVEAVDGCLARLDEALARKGGAMLITADHGNAEMMRDTKTGQSHTAHTMNKVPLIVVGVDGLASVEDGRLADLAPTLLDVMGLEQPAAMSGHSLIHRRREPRQDAAE